jgi:dienelactone hydrolase
VIDGVSDSARRPINTDAVVAGLVDGSLDPAATKAGDTLIEDRTWREIHAADDGAFNEVNPGSYILVHIASPDDRVMMLDAAGHSVVYVNGEPRMGDPYGLGYVVLPVHLHAGANTLLFGGVRGGLHAALHPVSADIIISDQDLTLPDLLVSGDGAGSDVLLGVPVINAATEARTVTVRCECGPDATESGPVTLPPCSITKLPLTARCRPDAGVEQVTVEISALAQGAAVAEQPVTLDVRSPSETHKRTYLSRIDGSVQYVAIVPSSDDAEHPALTLSLHGASVEATNQARAYAARPGMVIACPTNRRPFGFDWEDWGRIDALEAMDLVKAWYDTDPSRQYLTGHSMGGHGTWNLGVLHAERFAAIAPSAGWLSFDSYTGSPDKPYAPDDAIGRPFQAARASSMTLDYFENLRGKPIYILHGDADDNVPVTEARAAREALERLGIPCTLHEQPGAGHWWDDDKPGAACVDWPGIWETFAAADPLPTDATTNLPVPLDERGFVTGSFKRVFDRSFVLVYSTGGSEPENEWALAKARFDAEQWWYRGNGYAPVLSDAEFLASPRPGNVVLYGNAETNQAWDAVIASEAVQVGRGYAVVGEKRIEGSDVAVLAALPRRGRGDRLVGIVGGTGPEGMRATERLPYFTSGVGFPEVVVMRAGVWRCGYDGVEGAGQLGAMTWKSDRP